MAVTNYQTISTAKSEFSLNGLKIGDQFGADVVALANGGFALSYGTASGADKFLSVSFFDEDFAPIGPAGQPFTIPYAGPSAGVGLSGTAQIVEMPNGNVAVYWARPQEISGHNAYYSVIDPATGVVLNRQVLLSNMFSILEMEALVLDNGLIAICTNSGNYPGIRLLIRTSTGSHSSIYELDTPFANYTSHIAAATLSDGGLVVCYVDTSEPNALRFDLRTASGGRAGSAGALASGTASNIVGEIAVCGTSDAGFAVAYANAQAGVTLFIVNGNASGLPTVGPIRVDTNRAAIEADVRLTLVGDKVLVTWTEIDDSGHGNIMARLMDETGQPVAVAGSTRPFLVAGGVSDQTEAQATVLASGAILFTWTDATGDGTNAGIRGKIVDLTSVWIGDAESNHLVGKERADLMRAKEGDDTLDGGGGADTLLGGTGNDVYVVDDQHDIVKERPKEGVDHVYSSISWSMTANTELLTLTGSDDLTGRGGAGADTMSGNSGNNQLIGRQNADRIEGNGGADSLYGNDGNDILEGGEGDDYLNGGGNNDLLSGGTGEDLLVGGLGRDTLHGGADQDRFVFQSCAESAVGAGRDIIADFEVGFDWIDLKRIDANVNELGNNAFSFIGSDQFSAAGQLRFASGKLSGDVDGDGVADFQIELTGVTELTGNWLIA